MKKSFLIIFFLLVSCSSNNKQDLVDLDAFFQNGKKIKLDRYEKLILKDTKLINKITNTNFTNYKNWSEKHQNPSNLVDPVKIIFKNKKKINYSNISNLLIHNNKIIIINKSSLINVFDFNFKKIISRKIYKKKAFKGINLIFSVLAHKDKLIISDNLGNIHIIKISNLKDIWVKKLEVPFKSDIKLINNNIYLVNSNSKIFSINLKSSDLNWSFETASEIIKDNNSYQIASNNNYIYFTNDSSEIYCLDLKKNSIIWSLIFETKNFQNFPPVFKSSPITIDKTNTLYVSTNNGYTYAVNSQNGSLIWSSPIYFKNRFVIAGKFLLNSVDNRLLILDKSSGKILFNKEIINSEKKEKFFFKDILVSLDYIYIFDKNGYIITLDKKNLSIIKTEKITDNFLYFRYANNKLFIVSNNAIIEYK